MVSEGSALGGRDLPSTLLSINSPAPSYPLPPFTHDSQSPEENPELLYLFCSQMVFHDSLSIEAQLILRLWKTVPSANTEVLSANPVSASQRSACSRSPHPR